MNMTFDSRGSFGLLAEAADKKDVYHIEPLDQSESLHIVLVDKV